jgi:hypothetical protein
MQSRASELLPHLQAVDVILSRVSLLSLVSCCHCILRFFAKTYCVFATVEVVSMGKELLSALFQTMLAAPRPSRLPVETALYDEVARWVLGTALYSVI